MLNASQPSGAKATESFERRFKRSLIRLTVFYAAILAVLLFLSSSITYSAFSSRLGRRFVAPPVPSPNFIFFQQYTGPTPAEVRADLIRSLILANGVLFIGAVALSCWLAQFTLKPIKEAYERQRRFLSDASHELRTPLSIMRTDLENELAEQPAAALNRDRAESNLEEVERMSKLVNDLLTLSRLDEEAKTARASLAPANLPVLLGGIAKRLQPLARQHQVTVAFVPGAGRASEVLTDEDLFSHAVTNIVQNAILYNKPGGKAEIVFEERPEEVIVNVADTGIGVAPEDLRNIFDRFYRGDKSRSRSTGGSGLGLSIAQAAIERLGGSVEIISEVKKGTTVKVRLPRRPIA